METEILSELLIDDFVDYINKEIEIQFTNEMTLPATLIEARVVGGYTPLERLPFSLIFKTQQYKEYYQQGNYFIYHPKKGKLIVFLVPLGPFENGMKYEAIFS